MARGGRVRSRAGGSEFEAAARVEEEVRPASDAASLGEAAAPIDGGGAQAGRGRDLRPPRGDPAPDRDPLLESAPTTPTKRCSVGSKILLLKAPSEDPRELIRWTQTVVEHEALAVRTERERTLAGPAAASPEPGREDWVAMLPAGPRRARRAGRAPRAGRAQPRGAGDLEAAGAAGADAARRGLLLPGDRRDHGLLGDQGEPRVAEGRERFRRFSCGARAATAAPSWGRLISALADGEAAPADVATLRRAPARLPPLPRHPARLPRRARRGRGARPRPARRPRHPRRTPPRCSRRSPRGSAVGGGGSEGPERARR